MLESHRLRIFVEVVHAGSIAAAARKLRFTSSAVSQQIAKLETEVGQQLLVRQAQGVLLTAPGRELLERAESILAELGAAYAAVQLSASSQGRLTVASFASAAWAFGASALSSFSARRPDVSLHLLDIEPPQGYGEVRSGEIDVLITHCYPGVELPADRGLYRNLLINEPLRLVGHERLMPKERADGTEHGARLAEFAQHGWISGGADTPSRQLLNYLAEQESFRPRVTYETADYRLTTELVAAGLGVSIVPESVARDTVEPVRVLPIDSDPVRQIFLVRRRRATEVVEEMEAILRVAARRMQEPARGPLSRAERPE